MSLLLLIVTFELCGSIPDTIITSGDSDEETSKPMYDDGTKKDYHHGGFLNGILLVIRDRPDICCGILIRVSIAMGMELLLDGFLKTVVTPAIASTGIGLVAAPATFFLGQALQPIVHTLAFMVFDDRFLLAVLDINGIKGHLPKKGEWHKMSLLEGIITRYAMKSVAATFLGVAGWCTIIPGIGHLLTAFLTGWIVAWDYVYVPLSGMGYVGPLQQLFTVWHNLWAFQWFGFWAVVIEEIPFIGPACHVYNVYSAAFFLERLYMLKSDNDADDATASTVDSEASWRSWIEL